MNFKASELGAFIHSTKSLKCSLQKLQTQQNQVLYSAGIKLCNPFLTSPWCGDSHNCYLKTYWRKGSFWGTGLCMQFVSSITIKIEGRPEEWQSITALTLPTNSELFGSIVYACLSFSKLTGQDREIWLWRSEEVHCFQWRLDWRENSTLWPEFGSERPHCRCKLQSIQSRSVATTVYYCCLLLLSVLIFEQPCHQNLVIWNNVVDSTT